MLNELHDLAESLKSVEVSMASWHQHFKPCPKGTATLYLLVDSSGNVKDLEPITDRDRIASIRKWEVAAGISFPAFNVLPLFEPHSETHKKTAVELRKSIASKSPPTIQEIKERIDAVRGNSNSLWVSKEPARINKCLMTLPNEVAKSLGMPPPDFRSIEELSSRVVKLTAERLHQQLTEIVIAKILESPNAASDWFDLLFFHSGKTVKFVSLGRIGTKATDYNQNTFRPDNPNDYHNPDNRKILAGRKILTLPIRKVAPIVKL